MADAVFVDGVPAKITIHDFRRHCLYSFPKLTDSDYDNLISEAIDTVYSMFPGVTALWDMHPKQMWFEKTVLCYRLLTSWLIADQYPELAKGIVVVGVIKRKKVDGMDIIFNTDVFKGNNPLLWLQSNDFGRKALMMIQMSAKRALLRNCRIV